jgi:hypothetical protein
MLSICCIFDINSTRLFLCLGSVADPIRLLCSIVVKSFFNILNVNASPTLSAKKPIKYPDFLRLDPSTGQVQTNKISRCTTLGHSL